MAFINFNAAEVKPSEEFTPIPVGEYAAVITESESKRTKAGNGSFISLKFEIIEGQYKGRTVFSNLNVDNPNQQAVEIAMRDLSSICRAVNRMQITDTAQLHNQTLVIKVALEPRQDGTMGNVIKAYKPYGNALAQPTTTTAPTQQTVDDTKPAWMR